VDVLSSLVSVVYVGMLGPDAQLAFHDYMGQVRW
jgi:hypothetical protein